LLYKENIAIVVVDLSFTPHIIKAGHPERSEAESNFWMEERSEFIQKQATKERRDL
jgi:hypothetical protein